MSDDQKCFIIMPLTTPEQYLLQYSNDKDHFLHILEKLFVPAVKKSGFQPIRPIAQGSDNIPANIIKNLESTDIVLCDMSILNPNVFFELGIRTALNKAVCLVVDTNTPQTPFDTSTMNHYKYNGNITYWNIDDEINKLTNHILESKKQIESGNSLWQFYGMSNVALVAEPRNVVEAKLDYLLLQVQEIQKRSYPGFGVTFISEDYRRNVLQSIDLICHNLDLEKPEINLVNNAIELIFTSAIDKTKLVSLKHSFLEKHPLFFIDVIDKASSMKYRLNYLPDE